MKNVYRLNFLSIVLLFISLQLHAQDQPTFKTDFFNEVEFPEKINVSNQSLQSNGYGSFSKGLKKVFSCALYVEQPTDDAISLIYSDDLKVIDLVMTSNYLQSETTVKKIKTAYAKDLKADLNASADEKQFISDLRKHDKIITSQVTTVEKLFGEAFNKSNLGNVDSISDDIKEYIASFGDLIETGDHFRIISKNNQVTLFKNGEQLFQTDNKAFKKALMNIYLGNTPIDASLRESLLSM
ncbi:chalcone isomerase family protein [Flammeovirga sp. EKP202]|uniref:chalcone isomerase family protein n=1 Tax=Flammeovirga sp. EKP202 TaxID=2770592 RepID=UPI00165FB8C8|nr:chalcone isomerase family protein [Flammeovirga sp. EKP202]MBD0402640.1 chalcone isomerase family protein [Flammeovirga sp. EKP202]